MKILFLAGADSIHSKKWVDFFAGRGIETHWVSLVAGDHGSTKKEHFYILKNFTVKPFAILFNIFKIRKLIRKIKPDTIHAHYAGVYGILAAFSGFHPFVLTAWGSDILVAPKSMVMRPLIQFALRKADLITCDAEHMKNAMVQLGADASKIQIIYFGIDVKKFQPGERDLLLQEKLNIKNSPVVISMRSLEPIYNVETLIASIPEVLKKAPDVKFIIGGRGSEEDKLKKMAEDLGILGSIRFIGFVRNNELPKYLRLADVYVSTSLSDGGIASSTAEAMSCGLPVVITHGGDNDKWVKDGEGGYLIPIKSPDVLTKKVISLIGDINLRKKFGMVNRRTIEEKNNYYREMEKMEEFYKKIIQ